MRKQCMLKIAPDDIIVLYRRNKRSAASARVCGLFHRQSLFPRQWGIATALPGVFGPGRRPGGSWTSLAMTDHHHDDDRAHLGANLLAACAWSGYPRRGNVPPCT